MRRSPEGGPRGPSLGRLAWHIVQTLGEMGGHAGLAVDAANEKTPQPATANAIAEAYRAGAAAVEKAVTSRGPTAICRRDRHVRREVDPRAILAGADGARDSPPRADDRADAPGRAEGAGVYGPAREEWAAVTGCRRRSRCHLPLEGEPIDRQSGSSSSEAPGAAAVAAAVAAIDRKAAAGGRLELPPRISCW